MNFLSVSFACKDIPEGTVVEAQETTAASSRESEPRQRIRGSQSRNLFDGATILEILYLKKHSKVSIRLKAVRVLFL